MKLVSNVLTPEIERWYSQIGDRATPESILRLYNQREATHKICKGCVQPRHVSMFSKRHSALDGLGNICFDCKGVRARVEVLDVANGVTT